MGALLKPVRTIVAFVLYGLAGLLPAAQRPLDVYLIDVEGGKAMLVIAPSGESMLVDAGWPARFAPAGRDVGRIQAAMQTASISRLDNLVITHLDIDHLGEIDTLTSRIKVGRIIDNGPLQSSGKGWSGDTRATPRCATHTRASCPNRARGFLSRASRSG